MKTLGQRVREARTEKGMSQQELAKAVGVKYQTIQDLETGKSQGSKHIVAIAQALGKDPIALQTGKAGPAADVPTRPRDNIVDVGGVEFAKLPVFDIRFAAGAGAINDDEKPIDTYLISINLLRSMTSAPLSEIGVFQVDGDSMEPTINNRDWIFVDRRRVRLTNPGIYCLNFEGDALVKRAAQHLQTGVVTLISDNAKYPVQEITGGERLIVVGRVFLSIRRH